MKFENNFFKLLGLPQQFEVDPKLLKQRLRGLQRQYHPDRFAKATPQEQRLAAQFSAQVNTAATVLGSPVLRALHMLELEGIDVDTQNHTETDSGFLIEQMELRETLEEARIKRDMHALQALANEVAAAYRSAQQDFSATAVGQGAGARSDASADEQAIAPSKLLALVSKMRFFEKLNEEVTAAIRQLH